MPTPMKATIIGGPHRYEFSLLINSIYLLFLEIPKMILYNKSSDSLSDNLGGNNPLFIPATLAYLYMNQRPCEQDESEVWHENSIFYLPLRKINISKTILSQNS